MRRTSIILGTVLALGPLSAALPASAQHNRAGTYRVVVTCQVPSSQPERQLAPNSCLNYVPDGTQTYVAHVTDRSGKPVRGAIVRWTDSDPRSAEFRTRNNPCTTAANGTCGDELVDDRPRSGKQITVTATVEDSSGTGFLTFS